MIEVVILTSRRRYHIYGYDMVRGSLFIGYSVIIEWGLLSPLPTIFNGIIIDHYRSTYCWRVVHDGGGSGLVLWCSG